MYSETKNEQFPQWIHNSSALQETILKQKLKQVQQITVQKKYNNDNSEVTLRFVVHERMSHIGTLLQQRFCIDGKSIENDKRSFATIAYQPFRRPHF